MPIPTRADLKAYFQTGDHPTEAQFAALIDAIFDLAQQNNDNAQAAVDTADDALAVVNERSPRAYAHFKYTTVGTNRWTVDSAVGCTIVLSGTYSHTATITFDTPIGDGKYTIQMMGDEHGGSGPVVVSKTSTTLVLTLQGAPPSNLETADFIVFR